MTFIYRPIHLPVTLKVSGYSPGPILLDFTLTV